LPLMFSQIAMNIPSSKVWSINLHVPAKKNMSHDFPSPAGLVQILTDGRLCIMPNLAFLKPCTAASSNQSFTFGILMSSRSQEFYHKYLFNHQQELALQSQ
jgi:hypothetical protein